VAGPSVASHRADAVIVGRLGAGTASPGSLGSHRADGSGTVPGVATPTISQLSEHPQALFVTKRIWAAMVMHCLRAFPEEGCGLLAGDPETAVASTCYPTANAAASARVYSIDSRDLLRVDRQAESSGESVIGVFHSHTHTDAYPSPTDVGQAPDPSWHYVVVSLRDSHPVVRSYRIIEANVVEEPVVIVEDPVVIADADRNQ